MKPFVIAIAFVVAFVALIGAVAWAIVSSAPPPAQPRGNVSLYVGDASANQTWAHVNMTFDRVEVHQNGSGWRNLTLVAKATLDLIPLTNLSALVARADVPVANYTQLRFHVSSVVGTLKPGNGACTAPGGATCVIYMSVPSTDVLIDRPFLVNDTKSTRLIVDIDLSHSIVPAGATWIFTPVLGNVAVEGPK